MKYLLLIASLSSLAFGQGPDLCVTGKVRFAESTDLGYNWTYAYNTVTNCGDGPIESDAYLYVQLFTGIGMEEKRYDIPKEKIPNKGDTLEFLSWWRWGHGGNLKTTAPNIVVQLNFLSPFPEEDKSNNRLVTVPPGVTDSIPVSHYINYFYEFEIQEAPVSIIKKKYPVPANKQDGMMFNRNWLGRSITKSK